MSRIKKRESDKSLDFERALACFLDLRRSRSWPITDDAFERFMESPESIDHPDCLQSIRLDDLGIPCVEGSKVLDLALVDEGKSCCVAMDGPGMAHAVYASGRTYRLPITSSTQEARILGMHEGLPVCIQGILEDRLVRVNEGKIFLGEECIAKLPGVAAAFFLHGHGVYLAFRPHGEYASHAPPTKLLELPFRPPYHLAQTSFPVAPFRDIVDQHHDNEGRLMVTMADVNENQICCFRVHEDRLELVEKTNHSCVVSVDGRTYYLYVDVHAGKDGRQSLKASCSPVPMMKTGVRTTMPIRVSAVFPEDAAGRTAYVMSSYPVERWIFDGQPHPPFERVSRAFRDEKDRWCYYGIRGDHLHKMVFPL